MKFELWQKILIGLLFLFFFTFLIRGTLAITQDLGRHLKLGEIIIATKTIPKTNLFSYTQPDHPFVNSHWLSEIIFCLIFQVFSFRGLIIFAALAILASFIIAFFIAYRGSAFWLSFLVSLSAIGILIERTDIRPEIFSFLLFSVYLHIFFRYQKDGLAANLLWILPILQVFWTNFHIYFFLGPLFYFFFFLERTAKSRLSLAEFIRSAEFRKIFAIGVLICLAVFINPNGVRGAFLPVKVAMGEYGYSIIENQTPFFLSKFQYHQAILFFFFVAWIGLIISALLNLNNIWRERKIFNLLAAAFVSLFGLYAVRNFPIFALVAIPLIAENCSGIYANFKKSLGSLSEIGERFSEEGFVSLEKIAIFPAAAFLIIGIFYNLPKLSFEVPVGSQKAVDFVIENNIQGNMLNNYDVGGYLIWRLWPERKVFVDNRPEAYSVDFLQSVYIPMLQNEEDWEKYSEEYSLNYIVFERTDITPWAQDFLKRISKDPDWPAAYSDERAIVFVKTI